MNILALDLGTSCGYAIHSPILGAPVYGTFDLKSRRFEGGGMRYLRFVEKLREVHAANPLGQIVYEEVRRHMSTDAAHVYGGLMGVLTAFCEDQKIPYMSYPVSHIKKFITGKGNAKKPVVMEALENRGFPVKNDDEADALALLLLRLSELKSVKKVSLLD